MSALRALQALVLVGVLAAPSVEARKKAPPEDVLAGSVREAGFVDVYRDAKLGRVVIGVHEMDTPFLLVTSLPSGIGSNDIGLDRGQMGKQYIARFRRVGERVLLIADNTRFTADSPDPDERKAAVDGFAASVLWAGTVLKDATPVGDPATVLVDIGPYLAGDRHGITAALAGRDDKGSYELDEDRSMPLPDAARSFPDNSEFESLLTFSGDGKNPLANAVAVEPLALSLRQHISFVRLPPPGFTPRAYHPFSGAFGDIGQIDFAQPLDKTIDVRRQPRFRLQKDANGQVIKPIVFYLDRGTPEPIRQALLDGARWWAKGFEDAGFPGGYRVELMPEGADPQDIRYNIISWTHRDVRGWSYGNAIIDPRTGEIIKGAVNLGSQRVRQDILIAEALMAPFDKPNQTALVEEARQMALARLRQLSAHEVGHTLGFHHNFAASRTGTGSVMDYPFPLIDLDANGMPRVSKAYGVGLGAWDIYLVKHGYGIFDDEAADLAKLRADIRAQGFEYMSEPDSRAAGDAHPASVLWDMSGGDALAGFDTVMRARSYALAHFSRGVLPPSRQVGQFEARLVPVYLLHRYSTDAVARLLGGASYRYGLAEDDALGATPVDAKTQLAARKRLLATLSANNLALPDNVLNLMTPPAMGYERDREYFATRAKPLFDPLGAADAAASMTLQLMLSPPRLQRLMLQRAKDPAMPGVRDTLSALLAATWQAPPNANRQAVLVQRSINWVVLDALMGTLENGGLHPAVESDLRASLESFRQWASVRAAGNADAASAADRIKRYLADPASVKLRPMPPVPPGAPI
jgi:Met-zincin/Domain of unknown function (DUF5117)